MWEQFQDRDYWLLGIGIWLAILSLFTLRITFRWRTITKRTKAASLDQILDDILKRQSLEVKKINELSDAIGQMKNLQKINFSKYALVRFNPFEDTGGDQSFALALLDGGNNGLVISSLHSRGGTRVYAKPVQEAKPTTHQFSKEEREVVEKAAQK